MDETLAERLPYASRAVNVLSMLAIHAYHIDLDNTTQQRWRAAMEAMRLTDSHADQVDDQGRLVQLLDILTSFDETFPDLSVEQLGATRYRGLIRGAATVMKHGEQLRTANSPEAYITVRTSEAAATAEIVTALATDYVINQPPYMAAFRPAVKRLTTAAGMVDTAIDARRDFQADLLAFQPTPTFRIQLLRRGINELAPLIPVLTKPRVIASFGTLALQAYKSEQLKRKS